MWNTKSINNGLNLKAVKIETMFVRLKKPFQLSPFKLKTTLTIEFATILTMVAGQLWSWIKENLVRAID